MEIKNFKKIKLPAKPGVYFFKKGTEIVYIGKATSLRDRVKSYFSKDLIATRGPLLVDMVFQASKIDFQETDSVLEAIILEAFLIKKHQPKYNTKEKSDKSFLSVVITAETMPQVLTIRTRNLNEHSNILKNVGISKTYGPFTNGTQLRDAMKIIRRIFPYRDDKSSKQDNYEFYRQLGLTPDVRVANKEYLETVKNINLFFQGKKKKILISLKKEMKNYVTKQQFEKAGEIKKRIFALTHINDVALIRDDITEIHEASFRIEAYDIAHMGGKNMVGVMTVIEDGQVAKYEYKKFKIRTQSDTNDTGALYEVLSRRLKHIEWQYPNLIVVDGSTAQINTAKRAIKEVNVSIPIVSVIKDDRHRAKDIGGDKVLGRKYEREILLVNSEAHRFSIAYHKKTRNKNFLK